MGTRKPGKPGNGVPPADGKFSLISDEKLISLYKNLLRSRTAGRNGNHGSPRVEDAPLVGTAIDLGPGDAVCSLDRHHFAALSRPDAIDQLLLDQPGSSSRKNGASPSSFAHAIIGAALANKTAKNEKVTLVYCACTNAECLREAIHVATVNALPMVFVQQANGASETKAKKKSGPETPWFPSITVDTNDVVAVYRVANEAISRARLGRGPTLIECRPFLPVGMAKNGNGQHASNPVLNMEHYLRAKGLFDSNLK